MHFFLSWNQYGSKGYCWNIKCTDLFHIFQSEKKSLKLQSDADAALLEKSSLDITLLPEDERDLQIAKLLKYSAPHCKCHQTINLTKHFSDFVRPIKAIQFWDRSARNLPGMIGNHHENAVVWFTTHKSLYDRRTKSWVLSLFQTKFMLSHWYGCQDVGTLLGNTLTSK